MSDREQDVAQRLQRLPGTRGNDLLVRRAQRSLRRRLLARDLLMLVVRLWTVLAVLLVPLLVWFRNLAHRNRGD